MTRLDGTQMLEAYQESLSTNHGWEEDKFWWMSYYKGKKKRRRGDRRASIAEICRG